MNTIVSSVLKNCCWHEFQGFCGSNHLWAYNPCWFLLRDDVIRRKIFVWMLNVFVYLINFCWQELLSFCGITWMLIAYDIFRIGIFLFVWMLIASIYFINCCLHEIQRFCESNHIWAYNEVDAYCKMASSKLREISVLLEADFFCLFKKLLQTKTLRKKLSMKL